jgi:hypothetical protein
MRPFVFLTLLLALCPAPARAADVLTFRDKPRDAREEEILRFLEREEKLNATRPYAMAAVDLNNDGVDEWIVRRDDPADCAVNAACPFTVVGLTTRRAPALLGTFTAGKVGIDDETFFGVRSLRVYNNLSDDYAYARYLWTPESAAFLPD